MISFWTDGAVHGAAENHSARLDVPPLGVPAMTKSGRACTVVRPITGSVMFQCSLLWGITCQCPSRIAEWIALRAALGITPGSWSQRRPFSKRRSAPRTGSSAASATTCTWHSHLEDAWTYVWWTYFCITSRLCLSIHRRNE